MVLVGVTGVGKSTALSALRARQPFSLLPDRRDLTDVFMIAPLAGGPVHDREERFRITAEWRRTHAGGMAELVAGLHLDPATFPPPLLFDGLRGEDEVRHAAAHLPLARFVTLLASDVTRVRRLLGRADPFDRAAESGSPDSGPRLLDRLHAVEGALDVLGERGLRELSTLATDGVSEEDVLTRTRIVVSERRHYDPEAAAAVLRGLPPERSLVVDTDRHTSAEVAALVGEWL